MHGMWQEKPVEVEDMIVKTHKMDDGRLLIAVVDSQLKGKVFEEGIKFLDLSGEFYNGKEQTPSETADLMRNSDMLNIVGEEAIKLAISEELIQPLMVKRIAN